MEKQMKKPVMETPEIQIIFLSAEDVITTSNGAMLTPDDDISDLEIRMG